VSRASPSTGNSVYMAAPRLKAARAASANQRANARESNDSLVFAG
jgi:hypothetical protein